ncbi:hypothetical protein [Bradyrhizobium sp. JYMT SZCCT0428]|uniref:hypothetical protein n=1 Tax=Bradyrhizobium sp. JYMT SZCCT0428 TaxID=2807673 RepID=UPI001BADA1D5|nr:hypothetical protein [Bradyrhizobium sp. JYMT SZCCT0428]MBR1150085.1 hypothetical protein [Bradyrhizobium sp. JYMT SZCCT0428]
MWLGDFTEDFASVVCMFTTHASTGAPVAPNSAFEAADVVIYKNGNGAQKATTNGVTMTSPFDSVTGLHCVTIDTSNDTGDGGFWVTGAVYTLVLTPDETVDSVTVAKVIGQFGIELSGALRPTTAGRKLDVSAGGEAGVDWANVGSPTTVVGLSGTTIKTATDVETDTVDIQSRLPAALVSGRMDSSTGAMAANVMTAAAAASDLTTELQSGLATAVAVATLQTSVDDVPTNAELATALASADDPVLAQVALVKAKTDLIPASPAAVGSEMTLTAAYDAAKTAATQTSVNDLPTNAELATALGTADDAVLTAIGALNNLSAAQVNTEVDTALADVGLTTTITGRIDVATSTRLASGSYTAPDNAGITSIGGYVVAIDAKTANLPSDPADQSLIIAATSSLATLIGDVPTNAELTTALASADDATLAAIALVKAKTDLIPGTIDGKTFAEIVTLVAAVLLGKANGLATTTARYRALDDAKDRVVATVDADGNRSAVTLDAT